MITKVLPLSVSYLARDKKRQRVGFTTHQCKDLSRQITGQQTFTRISTACLEWLFLLLAASNLPANCSILSFRAEKSMEKYYRFMMAEIVRDPAMMYFVRQGDNRFPQWCRGVNLLDVIYALF